MALQTVTEDEEGKRVVNANGDTIGIVSGVRDGVAYVDPDPGIGDKILSKLGWDNVEEGDYPLDASKIEEVTDEAIHLKRNV